MNIPNLSSHIKLSHVMKVPSYLILGEELYYWALVQVQG